MVPQSNYFSTPNVSSIYALHIRMYNYEFVHEGRRRGGESKYDDAHLGETINIALCKCLMCKISLRSSLGDLLCTMVDLRFGNFPRMLNVPCT